MTKASVYCKRWYEKHIEYEHIRDKLRRKEYRKILNNLKINGCSNCGYKKNLNKLVFHHVIPENKKFNLCIESMSRKDSLIIEELNKCMLLCMSCHTTVHNNKRWNNGKIL